MKIIKNILLTTICCLFICCSCNKIKGDYLIFKSYEQEIVYGYSWSNQMYYNSPFKAKIDTLYFSKENGGKTFVYYKNKEKTKVKYKFIFNKKECLHIRFFDVIDTLKLSFVTDNIISTNDENNKKQKRWKILKFTTNHHQGLDICYTYFFHMDFGLIIKKAIYQSYVYELKYSPNIEEIDDLISLISNNQYFYKRCD